MKQILLISLFFSKVLMAQTTRNTTNAIQDFEKFWTTFKDNYAFFKLKEVNWDSSYKKYKPRINKFTTEKELVTVLQQMVEPLKDGHITITKGEEILYKAKRPSYFKQEFQGKEKEFWNVAFKTLMYAGFQNPTGIGPAFRDENLYYVSKKNDIGYLRITRCFAQPESIFDDSKEIADTKLMLRLLDSILNQLSDTRVVIIDMRANGGGHGGIELAERFAKMKMLTHYKAIREPGSYQKYSDPKSQYISPNSGIVYKNKVIILTNDKTASSAEDFVLSLYRQGNVTTIGANTSGMLSDMFSSELTGGISFTLSNQVYYDVNKEMLEDKGVPVKIEVRHTKQHLEISSDPVIQKALEIVN